MRFVGLVLGFGLFATGFAKIDPVGIYKPGVKTPAKMSKADQNVARNAKAAVEGGSLKLNKDKTFGMSLAGQVMLGKWALSGNILTINVLEIVGKTAKEVAKMPANLRVGRFKFMADGVQMVTLPEPPSHQPRIMWRKTKG